MSKTLYMVVPCYNEQEVLPETSKRLLEKLQSLVLKNKIADNSRIMFVNDGSKDQTWSMIKGLCEENSVFAGVNLSRNRGHQNALLAGMATAVKYAGFWMGRHYEKLSRKQILKYTMNPGYWDMREDVHE